MCLIFCVVVPIEMEALQNIERQYQHCTSRWGRRNLNNKFYDRSNNIDEGIKNTYTFMQSIVEESLVFTIVQAFHWLLHLNTVVNDVVSAQDPPISLHLCKKKHQKLLHH